MEFLEDKTIFITGATGFLAKILVEKILRVQPNVKKLYLLLRSVDETTAIQRLYKEVIEKDLFRILKEKWSTSLHALISEKITVVPGDTSYPNFGFKVDSGLLKEMKNQVEVIIHLAANTKFDERYDVALSTNTLGAKHVSGFANQCCNLKVLVHVSTAYVSGEREGLILETPYEMGESLNSTTGLDIQTEQRVVEERLNELRENGATDKTITLAMKDLGLTRAKMYGWPNTYVFTKAMGEMEMGRLKGVVPLVIIRPTMISSTYKEPFPGWIEGMRTIDTFIVGYGKGKLKYFLCDSSSIVDVIPADIVVNAIFMTVKAHMNQRSTQIIYHVGSSSTNSIKYEDLRYFTEKYFIEKPWINKDGKAIKVGKAILLDSMVTFQRYMAIRYLFLKGLKFANTVFCLSSHSQHTYNERKRKFDTTLRLLEIYRPYLFFKAIFDDTNTERLRITTRNDDVEDIFCFDPRVINWVNYFLNIHIPGVVRYIMK